MSTTITDITKAQRDVLAAVVCRGRLGFAVRVGRTDSLALGKCRRLAEEYNYPFKIRTMKQALTFLEAFIEEVDAL